MPNHGEISTLPQVALRSTSGYAWFAISDGPSLRSLGVYSNTPYYHRHITKHIAAVAGRIAIHLYRQLIYFGTSLCPMQSGILELSAKRVLAV
ncbi:MAG: hypothetical protein ACI30V_00765 [Muribaculaceae bacterium]